MIIISLEKSFRKLRYTSWTVLFSSSSLFFHLFSSLCSQFSSPALSPLYSLISPRLSLFLALFFLLSFIPPPLTLLSPLSFPLYSLSSLFLVSPLSSFVFFILLAIVNDSGGVLSDLGGQTFLFVLFHQIFISSLLWVQRIETSHAMLRDFINRVTLRS